MGPGDLSEILSDLPLQSDPDLLTGLENSEDAGVYRLSDEIAVVQTVDFFTPVVDDPYLFGQVAAANALSDVYAMGGVPKTALNLVFFPLKRLDGGILKEILRGGLSKIHEAGAVLVGGHSVEDDELKYGLSVTGTVHPDRVVKNSGARPGDALVLTKALGTGIVSTALKKGKASEEAVNGMIERMTTLNKVAAEKMVEVGAHGCTDITGFGLIGHGSEMAQGSGVCLSIEAEAVPRLAEAIPYLEKGMLCGGTRRNRDYFKQVEIGPGVSPTMSNVLFDAQTSGGLLVSLSEDRAPGFVESLKKAGVVDAAIIGCVKDGPAGLIRIR